MMEHKLLVPVRTTAAGTLALRMGRLPSGERTGLAFTSEVSVARTLGPAQQWTDMSWEALLDMLEPLGIEHVRVDPEPESRPGSGHSPQPALPSPGGGQPLAQPAALRACPGGDGCEVRGAADRGARFTEGAGTP
jgi:hypothetical protein